MLVVVPDRRSATTARIRFFGPSPALETSTLIQYTNVSSHFNNLNRLQFHTCILTPTGCNNPALLAEGGREITIPQGTLPITSYILRGLTPSTTYQVRVAYFDTSSPPQIQGGDSGAAQSVEIITLALDSSTTLSSLVASGGCGSYTNSSVYNLTSFLSGSERIYHCDVVYDISNITVSLIPPTPYSSITPITPAGTMDQTTQPLSVSATTIPADPYIIYTRNILLGGEGTTTNFTFIVTSESNINQTHTLSIRRVPQSLQSIIRGPTSPVTAMIRSGSIPSEFDYRALLWESTAVDSSSWKVWSDDTTIFPFSSFNITFPYTQSGSIDYTLLRVLVSPVIAHNNSASCSNIHIGLFPSNQRSSHITTCVTALNDYCSATPFGVATKWTSYYDQGGANRELLFNPPPPTPTFPVA